MALLTTNSEIKHFPTGLAIDITYWTDKQIKELKEKELYFNEIAWSRGTYGVNGQIVQGHNTKQLYKITSRTQAIYCI